MVLTAAPLLREAYLLAAAVQSPFGWRERDWNGDGRTSYGEFRYAINLGKRPAECPPGPPGTEYFQLKDGAPYRVNCARRWSGPPGPVW
ncbi:MAG TPA: hypothetical protein VF665_09640 [Longimicrobium sp.]|jgi:hypothetical protein|uniref:hypothetical protein n=1 Tax=Longimicrobium sp. TaxID=2029185 RepID=UPI002ED9ED90